MATGLTYRWHNGLFWLIIALLFTPALASASLDKPFLTSSASNSRPFVGQEIVLTYTLCFKDSAPKISRETNPSLRGLWAKESAPDRFIKSAPATVEGKHVRSAVVRQYKLVPVQSGTITVSGYSMQCFLPQQTETTTGQKEAPDTRIDITAPAITLSVLPLPEPVPEGFTGAVGNFSFNVEANKQHLDIGEPLTLKLTLAGTGSLLTLELPSLQLPETFRSNRPEKTTTLQKESALSQGTITSTIIAWPQSEGNFLIPALRLVVFNSDTQRFSTLLSKPVAITVTRPAQAALAADTKPPSAAPLDTTPTGKLIPVTIIIAVLLLTAIAVVVRRKKLLPANIVTAQRKRAVPQAENNNSPGTMKAQLFNVLERAGIKNPGCLTRKELEQALQEIKMSSETQNELPAVLDSLDKIMYSPAEQQGAGIPDGIVAKINAILNELKQKDVYR